MKSIIVGTAGHIDHGKTALVKALTGIDADRLQEEKRRGITIDLGFAHMDLPGLDGEMLRLGFVDVPGHERFVRNMLAGVGGIDLVFLVIAADEAIKPQTREHFDILQLIGVQRGITVLTKSDAVDAETLEVVRLEVEDFLRGTFLESPKAPVIAISSLTGAGLPDLTRAIAVAAADIKPRNSGALARLPIDRVFTMKGFGTVVTGTLTSGTIHKDDELEVFPTERRVRVRGVQVHGCGTDLAIAGQRTALNLAGASTEELARGMTLAPASTFRPTRQADVKLRLLPSAPRPLKNRARVHFHSNTMEATAEVKLYGSSQLAPGESQFARLTLPNASLLLPGDRFIIRQFSPIVTVGGGTVLDASPVEGRAGGMRRSSTSSNIDFTRMLQVFESGRAEEILIARVMRRGLRGLSFAEAVAETGWRKDEIAKLTATKLAATKLAVDGPGGGALAKLQDRIFATLAIDSAQSNVQGAVGEFHKKDPLRPGMAKGELENEMTRAFGMAPELFEAALSSLVEGKKLEIVGEIVRLPGRGAVMQDQEAESKKKIEEAFASAGLKVPALADVLAGLTVDKIRAQKIVTLLLREKVLVKVSDDLVFHRRALDGLRRLVIAQKVKNPKMDVAKFKDLIGVTRKYAIPLLEYLDRERVTRRVGDAREIL